MQEIDIIQTGGVFGFAVLVLYLLRELRPVLRDVIGEVRKGFEESRAARDADREIVVDVQLSLAAMLERDRVRDERRKRESSAPPMRGTMPQIRPAPVESWDGQTTDVQEIKRNLREQHVKNPDAPIETLRRKVATPVRGVRIARPGTHHDEDR
ncbi:MAG: hypothetical protein M3R55_12170 [Acidobacteriota bacterium]|nr:hypothetical protein [Acidobacteriota bacterium]